MTIKKSIIYYNIGKGLLEEGKIKEALEAFEIAIFEEPGFQKARDAYKLALAELEKSSSSSLAEKVKARYLKDVEHPHFYLAKLYYFEGDYLNALDELTNALEEAKSDSNIKVEIFNLMGSIYYIREEFELLREYADRALELDKNSSGAHFNKGLWYKINGYFDEAKESFKKAISLNKRLFHAYDELGEIYINEGELEEAESLFKKVLEIVPDWINSYFALGEIALRRGEVEKSLFYFKKAQSTLGENERLLSKLGKVYNLVGDPANAIFCLEKLLKAGSATDEDLMHLGVAYLLLMMPTTALKIFKKLREIYPSFPFLQEFIVLGEMMEQLLQKLKEVPFNLRDEMGGKRVVYLPLSDQTTLLDFEKKELKSSLKNQKLKGREKKKCVKNSELHFLLEVKQQPEEKISYILSLLRSKRALDTLTSKTVKETIAEPWPEKEKDSVFIKRVAEAWRKLGKEFPEPDKVREVVTLLKDDVRLDYFLSKDSLERYRKDKRKKWLAVSMRELRKAVPLKKIYILAIFPEFLG